MNKKPIFKKWWFWVVIVFILVGVIGSGGKKDNTTAANTSPVVSSNPAPAATQSKAVEEKKPATKITYENFLKVKMGSSYQDVKAILGDGVEQTSSEVAGIKTIAYSWQNSNGSNIMIMLQNDKVVNKAQAFLGNNDAKITLDKYNQVNQGMTYDQVKAILGDGVESSYGEMLGTTTIIYQWINSNGSNMNATFQNGKMNMKAQAGLK